MSQTLILRGGAAHSASRLDRLAQSLSADLPQAQLHNLRSEYWYIIGFRKQLSADEVTRLIDLLDAYPVSDDAPTGVLRLVVPRLGTISPWSSKATDIAHQCGFDKIARIERGTAFFLHGRNIDKTLPAAPAILHDRMTESVLISEEEIDTLFHHYKPQPLTTVDVVKGRRSALVTANEELGLALSADEIDYLVDHFIRINRNPTDVELMMFAQANSEHCRHKIFNADWVIDAQEMGKTLFSMIRDTHEAHPEGTVVAYTDNASIIEGDTIERLYPDADGVYRHHSELTHILAKVETHNHPTAISPFPGAATGAGGEIRDEGATGRGSRPKAGLSGFSVSNLNIPGFVQPWEKAYGRPARIASALDIMIEGPLGGAAFNNEFGRPNLAGYFRAFEQNVAGEVRGYHKPIMIAGGIGNIQAQQSEKPAFPAGTLLIQLGGPGMLIGLGGGAASSMATGANTAELDFASVQRGNPEIQRRCQEVIDACWQRGAENPIIAIHDVGAGGLSNAMPELADHAGLGAQLELREVHIEEPGMSPREIWCNEAQERYVLAVAPAALEVFQQICARERCPFAVLGIASAEGRLVVHDRFFSNTPVDMEMKVLLGKPPKMTRHDSRRAVHLPPFDVAGFDVHEAAARVLRHPTVASKRFLITIGDRTVGGLTARDQLVGPWQVPVADVAVTAMSFSGYRGEAFAMGERTPLACVDAPASGRMAIGEAITNLAAADIEALGQVKLSANWMAAAGHRGEDARLFDTVEAVSKFCIEAGLSIPVGKDSLSMRTAWQEGEAAREVISPLSLIVTAFAPVADIRRTLTPQLQFPAGEATELLLLDLGEGRHRLGGSILAQVYDSVGEKAPDVAPAALVAFFAAVQRLRRENLILAYHDRSDGGLFATVTEMAFASRCGLSLQLDTVCYDNEVNDADGLDKNPEILQGRYDDHLFGALFAEELGAVVQIRRSDRAAVTAILRDAGLAYHFIGEPNDKDEIRFWRNAKLVLGAPRREWLQAWSLVGYHIARRRDDPDAVQQEFDALADADDPGLSVRVSFDLEEEIDAPFINRGARPRVAILREQGVNSQFEMAAAFERAGFEAVDVHMSDLQHGRHTLDTFHGLAACGGFSYGDVLGAGQGWAKSILFHTGLREQFAAFFARQNTFALGACNGCQMMAQLAPIIPGAEAWPDFHRNESEQFEARLVMVEVVDSPSILLAGMAGSRLPIVVSHGEGRAVFAAGADLSATRVALRYVDNYGAPTVRYPANPNGSPGGVTGFTTPDGRFTIMMPHPERTARTLQMSWAPQSLLERSPDASPWLRLFLNARKWLG
ncbi:phosphoribosylformylglycinamidine synthase [Betaproteobacteria bacterium]|nr:phosphoribosylformylglycinamidine synthase [Betaproteobacteria bacterium]GHU21521.1 phosphoribosylformylglycinamidine synthase [Betaproteobacteria bacterium]GHU27684.1 phosphoribosylformylglycinamidine synthase [Betaproteobacteria bacterium]